MKKYLYKNKKTGIRIQTDEKINDSNLELIFEVKSVNIKSNELITKHNGYQKRLYN